MSHYDWIVIAATFVIGFAINEYLRTTLQTRGHDKAAVGVAIVTASLFVAIVFLTWTAVTK